MSKTDRYGEKEYTCPICHKPVELERDRYADENGQIMHEECYLKRVGGHERTPPDDHHTE
jgi:hypothetical protein